MKKIENIKYKKYLIIFGIGICLLGLLLGYFKYINNNLSCNQNIMMSAEDMKNISQGLNTETEAGIQVWKIDYFKFIYAFILERQEVFTVCELIDLLVIDLKRTDRDLFLRMYSTPGITEDLVINIESGNFLLKIGEIYPEFQQYIGDVLYQHIILSKLESYVSSIQKKSKKYNLNDTIKGIFVYYLSELEIQSGLYWDLKSKYLKYIIEPRPINYFDYYLRRAYK